MEAVHPVQLPRRRVLLAAGGLAVAVAAAVLVVRGVLPGLAFSGDFTMIHAGATAWVRGADLYDFETLYDGWQANSGGDERPRVEAWFVALYPPPTYAVLGPLGALPWPVGRAAWLLLSLASLGGVAAWGRAWIRGGIAGRGAWPLLLLTAWLAFGPVATTLRFGQLGLVVLGLVLLAVGTPGRRPPAWLAGAALAVAGCLKPQLAGVFALGFVALGRWRELGWTLGVGLSIAAVSVLRLEAAGVDWLGGLLGNVRRFAGTGFADPSPANPVAWQMVNLDPLWRRFFPEGGGVGAAVAGLTVVSAAAVAEQARRDGDAEAFAPWTMAVAAVLTLLVAYHRAYDAVLLAVPAVWALRAWAAGRRWTPGLVLAGVAAFGPPLPELLNHLAFRGVVPPSADWPFALETAVMFHRPAVLVAVLGILLAAGVLPASPPSYASPPDPGVTTLQGRDGSDAQADQGPLGGAEGVFSPRP